VSAALTSAVRKKQAGSSELCYTEIVTNTDTDTLETETLHTVLLEIKFQP